MNDHQLNPTQFTQSAETEAQLAFLAGKRCDSAQGFLLSRPVAADRFVALMAEWGAARPAAAD